MTLKTLKSKNDTPEDEPHEEKMTFLEHLEELRKRLIICAVSIFAGMIICWIFREQIRAFLEAPLYEAWATVPGLPKPQPLSFTSLLEPFVAYLKISAVGGIFLAAPVILYNLWKFIAPGLYPREKKIALPFVAVSSLLFVGGSLGAYTIVFPIGFSFFLEFAAGGTVDTLEATINNKQIVLVDKNTEKNTLSNNQLDNTDADLTNAGLTNAGLIDADLTNAGLIDAGLIDAGLIDAGLIDADLVDADLVDAGLIDSGLNGALSANDPKQKNNLSHRLKIKSNIHDNHNDRKNIIIESTDSLADNSLANSKKQKKDSWYEWLVKTMLKKDCGTFEANLNNNDVVAIKYNWDKKNCGSEPKIVELKRNNKKTNLEWKIVENKQTQIVSYTAFDNPKSIGDQSYVLKIVHQKKSGGELAPVLMVKDYLTFAVRLLLAFGIVFELPVLISFLAFAGIVNYKQLLQFSRWFIVLSVVLAAMLTPPDVVTQILLAAPLIVLYFLSVLVAFFVGKNREKNS